MELSQYIKKTMTSLSAQITDGVAVKFETTLNGQGYVDDKGAHKVSFTLVVKELEETPDV